MTLDTLDSGYFESNYFLYVITIAFTYNREYAIYIKY